MRAVAVFWKISKKKTCLDYWDKWLQFQPESWQRLTHVPRVQYLDPLFLSKIMHGNFDIIVNDYLCSREIKQTTKSSQKIKFTMFEQINH